MPELPKSPELKTIGRSGPWGLSLVLSVSIVYQCLYQCLSVLLSVFSSDKVLVLLPILAISFRDCGFLEPLN